MREARSLGFISLGTPTESDGMFQGSFKDSLGVWVGGGVCLTLDCSSLFCSRYLILTLQIRKDAATRRQNPNYRQQTALQAPWAIGPWSLEGTA